MTRASTPLSVVDMLSTESFTTSSAANRTADVSTAPTLSSIAPRTTVDDEASDCLALSTLRTAPTETRPGVAASRSSTRRPVWPVAPATITVFVSPAMAAVGRSVDVPNATAAPRASRRPTTAASAEVRARVS
eukprot:scaffold24577_cov62-Isochrysis_galbana.AAC.2